MRKSILPVVAAAAVGLACDVGKEGSCGTFVSSDGGSQVQIRTEQRMPTSWGGEEYVYAQLQHGTYQSPRLEIDNNGRFCRDLDVNVSRVGHWARVYLHLAPPWVGEVVPIDGGKGGYWFKSHANGETSKQERFPYTVVAYVDFAGSVVLRHSSATVEERGGILGLVRDVPTVQEIRKTRIDWLSTTKQ